MVELVLDQAIPNIGSIDKTAKRVKLTVQTHFDLKSSLSVNEDLFARMRMPTTGVRPQSWRVVFAGRTALQ
jgi:hypothetical protein